MILSNLLAPKRTHITTQEYSKKDVLKLLSELVSQDNPNVDNDFIFQQLIARERLGTTALGDGIALPHIRLEGLDHTIGALILLREGIDYDSPDEIAVDLFLGLLVPEEANETHLETLSNLAALFSQASFCHKLRQSKDDWDLFERACTTENLLSS